jgi:hypothetical protein
MALLLAVLLTAPSVGLRAQEPTPAPPAASPAPTAPVARGRILGKVLAKDGKTPVVGAIVRASHLRTAEVVASAPTDRGGDFALDSIAYGYVDLTVETPEGAFVASQVVSVPPDGSLALTLVLQRNEELPQGWWSGRQPRALPGTDKPALGVATVQERGAGFFRSKKGIAILGGAGALALIALSGGGGGGETPASPSTLAP